MNGMAAPNKIYLPNRYGYKVWLSHKEGNSWILNCEDNECSYIRVIGVPNIITAIDPPGGPFLSLGYKVADKIITKITWDSGYIISLEDDNKEN